jgi:phosphoserine phosphatase
VAAERGLNIDNITRLSGRVPLENLDAPQASKTGKACVEFSVRGQVADTSALQREFMALGNAMDVDIAFQEDSVFRRNRRLVAFDMDSTLIDAEVIDELALEAGVGAEVAAITDRAMHGELDFRESLRLRVSFLQGLDEAALTRVAARLSLNEGAETLIRTLQKLGYKTAILSGGFCFFGKMLQQKLGIDYVHANTLEIVEGKLTGRVLGEIVDGARKAQLLRDIAQQEGFRMEQVIAVGDGANDLPMLSIAGLGIAFRAKPIVRARAQQSLSTLGLDGILYLMGLSDRETI